MADIRQAAQWIRQGKRVRRPCYGDAISIGQFERGKELTFISVFERGVRSQDKRTTPFDWQDFIADDWEVLNEQ